VSYKEKLAAKKKGKSLNVESTNASSDLTQQIPTQQPVDEFVMRPPEAMVVPSMQTAAQSTNSSPQQPASYESIQSMKQDLGSQAEPPASNFDALAQSARDGSYRPGEAPAGQSSSSVPVSESGNMNFEQLAQAARSGSYNPEEGLASLDSGRKHINFDALANKQGISGAAPPMVQNAGGSLPPPRRRDQIANTSDVYLEQLKADTKSRKESFLVGDYEGHQSVWKTPRIKELENSFKTNPYFESEKERQTKMLEMFELTEEDALVMKKQMEEQDAARNASKSVSYKEKLAARKKNQPRNNVASSNIPTFKEEIATSESNTNEPFVMKAPEPFLIQNEVDTRANPVGQSVSITSSVSDDDESERRLLRTLMGLILKHRGGPGFGAGFLKGPDVARFESTLAEVTQMLSSECGSPVIQKTITKSSPSSVSVSESTQQDQATLTPPLDGSIQCIEAIVEMYKNAPAEQREELVAPLRDALANVVTKLDGTVIDSTNSKNRAAIGDNTESVGDVMSRVVNIPEPSEEILSSNSELFLKAKDTLVSLTGNEKYGLSACSSIEAQNAIELLKQVRVALMDELDFGQ